MNNRSVRSYLVEGLVIIASILVAFALDASWANYQESRVEARVLSELLGDLSSAERRISTSITELETAIAASTTLVENLGANTSPMTPAVAQDLFNVMFAINTLEVPSSVLDSIIASGQVRLISNVELRTALSEWPAFVADVRENHEWHRVETDEYLIPYMAQHLSIRDANIRSGLEGNSPGTFEYDVLKMQRDPVFEGRLHWRMLRQQATLTESNVLMAETQKLMALIVAETD